MTSDSNPHGPDVTLLLNDWASGETSALDRLMPMLYPEEVWKESFPNFTGTPWVAGLMVLYVVDEEHAYWFLRSELLDRWQIDSDELHAIALENLAPSQANLRSRIRGR